VQFYHAENALSPTQGPFGDDIYGHNGRESNTIPINPPCEQIRSGTYSGQCALEYLMYNLLPDIIWMVEPSGCERVM
jgi:hypothetical protein